MNSSQIKQNWPMLLGGFIVLLAAGTTLWFIRESVQKQNQLDAEIAAVANQITNLRGAAVFPSEENIRCLKDDLQMLESLYAKMHMGVGGGKIEVEPLNNGVQFVGFLRKHQTSLREEAKTAGVSLPESFSFGFSRYDSSFPCRAPELKGEQCANLVRALAKQVVTVKKICQILFDSKVQSLNELRRVDIEGGQAGSDALAANAPADVQGLYTTTPFELKFSCDTTQLQNFLNGVTQSDWFLAVRTLKVETEAHTVTLSPTGSAETSLTAPAASATPATETLYRLSATARIDLVEFETASTSEAIGTKKNHPNL